LIVANDSSFAESEGTAGGFAGGAFAVAA